MRHQRIIGFIFLSLIFRQVNAQPFDGSDIKGIEELLLVNENPELWIDQQSWRRDAAQRIDQYRKQTLLIKLENKDGLPISGATIHAKLVRHDFAFGTAFNINTLDKVKDVLSNFGNQIGFSSALKYKRKDTLGLLVPAALEWAKDNSIDVRGHNLVWPGWKFMHADAHQYRDGKHNNDLKQFIENQIIEAAEKWDVMAWDVMNEPLDNQDIQQLLGYEVMADWFKIAAKHRRNKDALLYINENRIISAPHRQTERISRYREVIDSIISQGGPVEAIGVQARFRVDNITPDEFFQRLESFADLDLPIMATEFEIVDTHSNNFFPSDLRRAEMTENTMMMLFSHPRVNGIMAWTLLNGLKKRSRHSEPVLDIPENRGLLNWDMSLPLNGKMWLHLIKQRWHTDIDQTTDINGQMLLYGFKGQYKVQITTDHGDFEYNLSIGDVPTTMTIRL